MFSYLFQFVIFICLTVIPFIITMETISSYETMKQPTIYFSDTNKETINVARQTNTSNLNTLLLKFWVLSIFFQIILPKTPIIKSIYSLIPLHLSIVSLISLTLSYELICHFKDNAMIQKQKNTYLNKLYDKFNAPSVSSWDLISSLFYTQTSSLNNDFIFGKLTEFIITVPELCKLSNPRIVSSCYNYLEYKIISKSSSLVARLFFFNNNKKRNNKMQSTRHSNIIDISKLENIPLTNSYSRSHTNKNNANILQQERDEEEEYDLLEDL
ncbi:Atg40p NDAI_0C01240 [Naumovozyma dairenensis CBS 421]|uniref:Uncharacterized protein n=1 Tax=Naumovozyma dairenensis (strain ATCC 10597 / BCRC 20456 / CBS 421 / NBRC 0211 / NRRL Y-12639) TaxID=1071378 RepID=G0W7M4_NAUDC|nr:hypothetical protein NDAI_0C01240 [Naumovozyma dairenensis CBS 421]CCD23785.1 hypothetical protein NDAI_0C01240 [Naumovozyma dairenensis CBS 421]